MKKIKFRLFITGLMLSLSLFFTGCSDGSEFPYTEITITDLQQGYKNGTLTVEAVVGAYLERIEKIDKKGPALNAMICINPDALAFARELDAEIRTGKMRGPLHGIPVVLKDNIDTHDKMPCTAGSRALKNSYPLQDSPVARQLRDAGAVILGKANLSEWANFRGELSSSGWSGINGQTKNSYILDRNPCGSSSGSAVAVSANLTVLAIGTETNGSIVCPSHANGIVGIKPTVGLISRSGIIPISRTQDTAGPMARSVRDAAICLAALTDADHNDTATLQEGRIINEDYTQFLNKDGLRGKRIGYYTAFRGINFKVDALMDSALALMKAQGAEIIEIDKILPDGVNDYSFEVMLYEYKQGLNAYFAALGDAAPVRSLTELIEFNKNDAIELRYYNQRYLEMAEAKTEQDAGSYEAALKKMLDGSRRNGIDRVMDEQRLDALAAPSGTPAWKTDLINGDSFQFGSSSPAAISGYPNITLPMGFIDGLPVGISIFGRAWSEAQLLAIAYAYEQHSKHRRVPEFLEP
ncbi:MAG: amidase [Candidatus Marinimicrobia bacterium]|jgi:amidase|nr:amidase [Candidatus Neomarinimicrobiota bacterium]MDD4960732.1 amidase [Candidatus Neomarinimicrobiota bacterium]MDD5709313.1 amidase [Candidatus Neomarinimicrobiota bacterium]